MAASEDSDASAVEVPTGVDPMFMALHKLRCREFDDATTLCTDVLAKNPYDQAAWSLKVRTLTQKMWVDDTDMEEEGIAEALLDETATAQVARPGTSLRTSQTSRHTGPSAAVRPMSSSGRPVSGFARPGSSAGSARGTSVDRLMRSGRAGSSRPMTTLGRHIRLGTASMLSSADGPFIDVEKLPLAKYAKRPNLAKALCDYILYHDHNPRKALELAAAATVHAGYDDWWWKARLGKSYYQLGMLREAEKQFKSALRQQDMVEVYLELAKVYLKMDQPNAALDVYMRGAEAFTGDPSMLVGMARVQEAMGDSDKSCALYKRVLAYDGAHVESIACVAANHFYSDQPEVALKYYRRLLQMGVMSAELWNNLGLCCFYSGQYDMSLSCFERGLSLASDDCMADLWYNVAHVGIALGDLAMAYQCCKIAVSIDPHHAEALTNLGVLEVRRGARDAGKVAFLAAHEADTGVYEAPYNAALAAFRSGNFQDAYNLVNKSLAIFDGHADSKALLQELQEHFTLL